MNYSISVLFRLIPLAMGAICLGLGLYVLDGPPDANHFVAGHVLVSLAAICFALFTTAATIIRQLTKTYNTFWLVMLPLLLLAPGLLRPWAAPGALGPARAPLLGRQALVRIASGATRADLAWLWRWRRNALQTSKGVLPPALAALEQLARYSHRRLHQTLETLQLDPETRRGGLVLLRSEAEHAALAPVLQLLRDAGVVLHELDAEAARAIEPGLCPQTPLACALHLPGGELGNCRLFALMLRQAAQALGVEFMFGTTVRQLHTAPAGVELAGDTRPRRFDAIVLCAGGASAELLRPLGLRLPLAQLHGYTVSTPLRDELHAPLASVVDASQRISITRRSPPAGNPLFATRGAPVELAAGERRPRWESLPATAAAAVTTSASSHSNHSTCSCGCNCGGGCGCRSGSGC